MVHIVKLTKSDLKWCIHLSRSLFLYKSLFILHYLVRHPAVGMFLCTGISVTSYYERFLHATNVAAYVLQYVHQNDT